MAVARSVAATDGGAEAPEEEQTRETVDPEPVDDPRSWTAAGVFDAMRNWRRRFPNADAS